MVQLERPTFDGSVRDTYSELIWASLSAVDCSPGRRSSPCVAVGSGSCHGKKIVKQYILLSEIYRF